MQSREHALLSLLVGALCVWALPLSIPWWAGVGYAVAVGVGIDLDHFLVQRVVTGEWDGLERVLADPGIVLFAQERIFEPGTVGTLRRLLSHHVIVGIAVGAWWPVSQPMAVLTAAVLYVHVLADLAWDVWRSDGPMEPAGSDGRVRSGGQS